MRIEARSENKAKLIHVWQVHCPRCGQIGEWPDKESAYEQEASHFHDE